MNSWPVQDANARFNELFNACLVSRPQFVSRQGADAAVLIPFDEWVRLQPASRPSLKDLLLSDFARTESLVLN